MIIGLSLISSNQEKNNLASPQLYFSSPFGQLSILIRTREYHYPRQCHSRRDDKYRYNAQKDEKSTRPKRSDQPKSLIRIVV